MSTCKECYHSYVCLNHGTDFGDCPMIQLDYDEKRIKLTEIVLRTIPKKKRNINLRRE